MTDESPDAERWEWPSLANLRLVIFQKTPWPNFRRFERLRAAQRIRRKFPLVVEP